MSKKTLARAVKLVDKAGILLVFPIENREDPPSLWNALHPGEKMVWEWDEDGDFRVADLWHLRAALAESREVVYAKWLRGRATVIAKEVFRAMLGRVVGPNEPRGLSHEAAAILELLHESSPQSTKSIRQQMDLAGPHGERVYKKALDELWARLLIVGIGEVDDGAFPSLAIGATALLFEDLWENRSMPNAKGEALLDACIARSKPIARAFAKSMAVAAKTAPRRLDE